MIGYVSDAVARALQNWPAIKGADIMPVRATDGTTVVVNTPTPAVAIHVMGDDGEGNTYFGGGIRQYFELMLYCILPITNYTFSNDGGAQAEMLDISDEVIRCMEQTKEFDDIRHKHDFNIQFDRMETDTTYGSKGALSITCDVHKVVYRGSVEFDPKDPNDKYDTVDKLIVKPNYVK